MTFKQFLEVWFSPGKGPKMFEPGPLDGNGPPGSRNMPGKAKGKGGGGAMPTGSGAAPQMMKKE
jgi:hypothetical protein